MRFRSAPLPLLALPLVLSGFTLSGCAVVAGTAAGVVLAHEVVNDSTYVVQLDETAQVVWEELKVSLSNQAEGPLDVDESLKVAVGKVNGRKVTASVESFDHDSARLVISASRFGVADGETADAVATRVIKDIREQYD